MNRGIEEMNNIGKINKLVEREYWWLFGGKKGGSIRTKIIKLLEKRPFNAFQIAKYIETSYNNVKYHLEVLLKAGLIKNDGHNYRKNYYLSKDFNQDIFTRIFEKLDNKTPNL